MPARRPKAPNPQAAAKLFAPLQLGPLELANRLAVAPMTRVSATADGRATPRMRDYYSAFAQGGFGLIITEGIYTDKAHAQGYLHQPGLTDDAQQEAWRDIVASVHAAGGRIVAQLMHAGALSQGNPHRSHNLGPSPVLPKGEQMTFYRGSGPYETPVAMTPADIGEAVAGFASAATRARAAGFDAVEIHGANGYLLDQFLTEGVNVRDDDYGGPVQARVRLILETIKAVRAAVGRDFPLGVRISQGKVNDFEHRWTGGQEDAQVIFSALAQSGVDYVHTTEFEAWRPAFPGLGRSLASLAKMHSGLPVIANGALHDPARAEAMLESGDADVVALARGALASPDWPNRVREANALPEFDRQSLHPIADLATADRLSRSASAAADMAFAALADADPALAGFLGKVVEIAIVTRDAQRTMEGLWLAGIGPWRVYTFTPENTTNQTYRGEPSPFTLRVCFAEVGDLVWELIQPIAGRTIFAEYLEAHGEGIHHVAFDCNGVPFADRISEFERRGFQLSQGGSWMGLNHFAFFETEAATTTCLETYEFPPDWSYPEPDAWYPAR
uniref:oxidoreductase n=1 Tax=uncultured Sphingomonas sp. TaxID=158754 RepID=UPI0025D54AE3|nr:VOC family protein [uncultured Sphingomonas sp.]